MSTEDGKTYYDYYVLIKEIRDHKPTTALHAYSAHGYQEKVSQKSVGQAVNCPKRGQLGEITVDTMEKGSVALQKPAGP